MSGEDGPDRQAGKAFWRSGCQVIPGEDPVAARMRGKAAECAIDAAVLLRAGPARFRLTLKWAESAVELLQAGDAGQALALLEQAVTGARMVPAGDNDQALNMLRQAASHTASVLRAREYVTLPPAPPG